jgi:hypothetical protein
LGLGSRRPRRWGCPRDVELLTYARGACRRQLAQLSLGPRARSLRRLGAVIRLVGPSPQQLDLELELVHPPLGLLDRSQIEVVLFVGLELPLERRQLLL